MPRFSKTFSSRRSTFKKFLIFGEGEDFGIKIVISSSDHEPVIIVFTTMSFIHFGGVG